jgi:thiol-disulfide isomerase/thioredoxin
VQDRECSIRISISHINCFDTSQSVDLRHGRDSLILTLRLTPSFASLISNNLAKATASYLFVDFFASWCSHCKDLAPTWEVLAETMTEAAMELADKEFHHLTLDHDYTKEDYDEALKVKLPVMVGKVDCVDHKDLCFNQQIWAYPTLRLFVNGVPVADYKGDRTVLEMVHWLAHVEEAHRKQVGDEKFDVLLADESKYLGDFGF